MRFMDVLLAFPSLLLAIAAGGGVAPADREAGLSPLLPALFAIGFVAIPVYARIVSSSVLSIKEQDFVLADQALGVPRMRILYPNASCPIR